MAPPTKRVPAAFHSELTEYASLLRAIRTRSTLDIVPQLTQAKPNVGSPHFDSDQESSLGSDDDAHLNDREAVREPPESATCHDVQQSLNGNGEATAKNASKSTKRSRRKGGDDTWTRWPLLKEHCPIPEWSFDEEVAAIAEQCYRFQSSSSQNASAEDAEDAATSGAAGSDSDDMSDLLSSAYLTGLTSDAASKLTRVLALLASHRVNATFAKHGRIAPMSWVDVLEVAGVAGVFDLA
jgi:hypothetical protein